MNNFPRPVVMNLLSFIVLSLSAAAANGLVTDSAGYSSTFSAPGCEKIEAKECLSLAIDAMGGRQKLEAIQSASSDVIGHTALMEQSYRQAPFITSYERDRIIVDFAHKRVFATQHGVWPEADLKGADSDVTLITTPDGGAYRSGNNDSPCRPADLESSEQTLALGPERLLLTASASSDLHYEAEETLRSTPHAVVAFTWNNIPVRILLGSHTHLPDAVDTTQRFHDFWAYWGDVHQRIYWDNWKFIHGIVYPTNQMTERNGAMLSSEQVLDLDFNQPLDEKSFVIAPEIAKTSKLRNPTPFKGDKSVQLAPDVTLYPYSWNTTIVKQDDGIVLLETPISSLYAEGLFAAAKAKYPGLPIKAVLSTSDSWPHVGGIRFDVAQSAPVYILDLNQPLLDRMIAAPNTLTPDALQTSTKTPDWKIVSEKTSIGEGKNRIELYPIRGASTERQYMVYFPEHHLLYASDTLVLNGDDTIYDPELMREVVSAAEREHLDVDTVFAMHQGPTKWSKVLLLLQKAG
jgi:hypothetical protein